MLTAVQNWTGIPGIRGRKLAALFALWLVGRVVMLFPNLLGYNLSAIIDLSFYPVLAVILGAPIWRIKQYRNLFFVPLFFAFTLINLMMHLAPHYPQSLNYTQVTYASVMLVTTLVSIMAGRVTPMFTANGTQTQKVLPIRALEHFCSLTLVMLALSYLLHPVFKLPAYAQGSLFIVAAIAQFIRWFRWKPWITFSVPLLWSMHFSMAFVWFGLLAIGLNYFDANGLTNAAAVWHFLTIGGLSGMVLAMIARVSLGHTGRPLKPAKLMSAAFLSVYIGALLRAYGVILFPAYKMPILDASSLFWFLAFGLFVLKYWPILCSPRADGRPG